MSDILLSICIPTKGRIDILRQTLKSIFDTDRDYCEFEVVLSDNSETDEIDVLHKEFKRFPNIVFCKSNKEGFLNSVNALENGKGRLLKLQNNYSKFREGALDEILSIVRDCEDSRPQMFFSSGNLKHLSRNSYNSFDSFMAGLSFWSSWSTGFCIWKSDFQERIGHDYNKMFPHTSLLFSMTEKSEYLIFDQDYFDNINVPNKGGYNIFEVFSVEYLNMVKQCYSNDLIRIKTFRLIKRKLFYNFLVGWYYHLKHGDNDYTFDISDMRKYLGVHYSVFHYHILETLALLVKIKNAMLRRKV